jgi:molybdenum cofactor sulfurtransferase
MVQRQLASRFNVAVGLWCKVRGTDRRAAKSAPTFAAVSKHPRSALAAFRARYPQYAQTALLDDLRTHEYARLDHEDQVYLDYTGGGLYAMSQINGHVALLSRHVYGNPHSINPTSLAMTELVEEARKSVLHYFNASADEYVVIFTANATGALRLIGEAYPFGNDGHLVITYDNHNSVVGIREHARAQRAHLTYVPLVLPDMQVHETALYEALDQPGTGGNLFVYPAQSNYTGVQHSLEWIASAQERGWDVALDAASFVPTNRLDLSRWHPEFVSLSFYKMFGYPTGVGCLLARRAALEKLHRPAFSGGTVMAVSVVADSHVMLEPPAAFEDGTVNYLSLPAITIGLRHLEHIGIDTIHTRVNCLIGWLIERLDTARHRTGIPVAVIHGLRDLERRGATIAINLLDTDGRMVDERIIEKRAMQHHLSVRIGCFCNPGAGEAAFRVTRDTVKRAFDGDLDVTTYDDYARVLDLPTMGSMRVSLGVASNFVDVHRFLRFIDSFIDDRPKADDLPPRSHC